MKTVKLKALRNLYYEGDRVTGEIFTATEDHASALVRVKSAEIAEDDKPTRYQRRDLRAED